MAEVTIGQLTSLGAGSRTSTDQFEVQSVATGSGKYTRLNGITLLESDLVTMDSSNYTLNASPLELVAAPGNSLQMLLPAYLVIYMDYATTVFDFPAGGIDLVYGTATGTSLINIPQAIINNNADEVRIYPLSTANDFVFNDSLNLFTGTDPTQGDSSVYFRLLYSLQDFNT